MSARRHFGTTGINADREIRVNYNIKKGCWNLQRIEKDFNIMSKTEERKENGEFFGFIFFLNS